MAVPRVGAIPAGQAEGDGVSRISARRAPPQDRRTGVSTFAPKHDRAPGGAVAGQQHERAWPRTRRLGPLSRQQRDSIRRPRAPRRPRSPGPDDRRRLHFAAGRRGGLPTRSAPGTDVPRHGTRRRRADAFPVVGHVPPGGRRKARSPTDLSHAELESAWNPAGLASTPRGSHEPPTRQRGSICARRRCPAARNVPPSGRRIAGRRAASERPRAEAVAPKAPDGSRDRRPAPRRALGGRRERPRGTGCPAGGRAPTAG